MMRFDDKISMRCPKCAKIWNFKESVIGKKGQCRDCGEQFRISAQIMDTTNVLPPAAMSAPAQSVTSIYTSPNEMGKWLKPGCQLIGGICALAGLIFILGDIFYQDPDFHSRTGHTYLLAGFIFLAIGGGLWHGYDDTGGAFLLGMAVYQIIITAVSYMEMCHLDSPANNWHGNHLLLSFDGDYLLLSEGGMCLLITSVLLLWSAICIISSIILSKFKWENAFWEESPPSPYPAAGYTAAYLPIIDIWKI